MNENQFPVNEEIKENVRKLLNTSKIKLWLEPHSCPDGSKNLRPTELIKEYSKKLKSPESQIEQILEELRIHSCTKLNANKKFQETGLATLNIRLASASKTERNKLLDYEKNNIEIRLDRLGSDLKMEVASIFKLLCNRIKLISSGRNIEDNKTLEQQNIKNFDSIMALCLTEEEGAAFEESDKSKRISRAKKAAELVADGNFYELQVADQTGKPIKLPKEEQRALSMAMMMHEKGRTALKKKNYGESLIYLLEADSEFQSCNSELLSSVDNYALLCLDIVWCYFCLQQVPALPQAEKLLALSEEKLTKSYGKNMERVMKVRGGASKENAVMVRLHLLQGILYFYKGLPEKSLALLEKTDKELKYLQVDEAAMLGVMEMGFSEIEARLALRFCGGNISQAIEHIIQENQERKRIRAVEREEKHKQRLQKMLGKTVNGQQADTDIYENLVGMGFNKGAALEALRTQNNDLNLALQWLQNHQSLVLPDPTHKNRQKLNITPEIVERLSTIGLDPEGCVAALQQAETLNQATSVLTDLVGNSELEKTFESILQDAFLQHSDSSSESSDTTTNNQQSEEEKKMDLDLVKGEILEDLSRNKDDYLDLSLEEEAIILSEFTARLASMGYSMS